MEVKSKIQIMAELDLAIMFEELTLEQWLEYPEEQRRDVILTNLKNNAELLLTEIINQGGVKVDGN